MKRRLLKRVLPVFGIAAILAVTLTMYASAANLPPAPHATWGQDVKQYNFPNSPPGQVCVGQLRGQLFNLPTSFKQVPLGNAIITIRFYKFLCVFPYNGEYCYSWQYEFTANSNIADAMDASEVTDLAFSIWLNNQYLGTWRQPGFTDPPVIPATVLDTGPTPWIDHGCDSTPVPSVAQSRGKVAAPQWLTHDVTLNGTSYSYQVDAMMANGAFYVGPNIYLPCWSSA